MSKKEAAEKAVREIRRKTRRRFSAEEKVRIVIEGLRAEDGEYIIFKKAKLNLILPSQLKALPFEIQQARSEGDRVEAVLKLNHWLFRYFAPTLQLVYDSKSRKLVEYRGISNILDSNGNRQDVRIVYKY